MYPRVTRPACCIIARIEELEAVFVCYRFRVGDVTPAHYQQTQLCMLRPPVYRFLASRLNLLLVGRCWRISSSVTTNLLFGTFEQEVLTVWSWNILIGSARPIWLSWQWAGQL
jgi:hypothetical protein